ncbi:MAG: MBL fold metallo-hydrolase [Patescibacteria group bacterium]|nr:MBL fold metallo-hydrolase [Patescibacteria group bacterium]
MIINYFGNDCFRLQSGDISLLADPENNRLKADITLKTLVPTEDGEWKMENGTNDTMLITFPGEYESKEIEIEGFPIAEESTEKFLKTAYRVAWEDMKIVFLGHLSRPIDATLMEEFADADILFLPIAGGHFLEPEVAAKIAKQLEARIIIPSFGSDKPDAFLKALGKKAEDMEKFVFKQKDIVAEKGKVVILKQG